MELAEAHRPPDPRVLCRRDDPVSSYGSGHAPIWHDNGAAAAAAAAVAVAAAATDQPGKELILRLERERGVGAEWEEMRGWMEEVERVRQGEF
jgi:hypothetical protein